MNAMKSISRRDFFRATAGGILLPFILEPVKAIILPTFDKGSWLKYDAIETKVLGLGPDNVDSLLTDITSEVLKDMMCDVHISWTARPASQSGLLQLFMTPKRRLDKALLLEPEWLSVKELDKESRVVQEYRQWIFPKVPISDDEVKFELKGPNEGIEDAKIWITHKYSWEAVAEEL